MADFCLVVIFGLFSSFIREKLRLGEAPVATVFGIIIGPHVLGLFDPYSWGGEGDRITNEITLEVTRVVIALSVFAVGVELPKVSLAYVYQMARWTLRSQNMLTTLEGLCLETLEDTRFLIGTMYDMGMDDHCPSHLGVTTGSQFPIITRHRRLCNSHRPNSRPSRHWRKVCGKTRSGTCPTHARCRVWM